MSISGLNLEMIHRVRMNPRHKQAPKVIISKAATMALRIAVITPQKVMVSILLLFLFILFWGSPNIVEVIGRPKSMVCLGIVL